MFYISHKPLSTSRGRLEGSTLTPPLPQRHKAPKGEIPSSPGSKWSQRQGLAQTLTEQLPYPHSQTSPGPIFYLGWRGRVVLDFKPFTFNLGILCYGLSYLHFCFEPFLPAGILNAKTSNSVSRVFSPPDTAASIY